VLPALISFKVFSVEKVSAYECGFEPFPELGNRHVDVHFVVVALLFLLFDFELLLLLPFVLSCESAFFFIGVKPVLNLFLFLLIVTLAFVYEWISGALTWPISVIPRV
jgi:NADH-quinone oxidoreductase subunit A